MPQSIQRLDNTIQMQMTPCLSLHPTRNPPADGRSSLITQPDSTHSNRPRSRTVEISHAIKKKYHNEAISWRRGRMPSVSPAPASHRPSLASESSDSASNPCPPPPPCPLHDRLIQFNQRLIQLPRLDWVPRPTPSKANEKKPTKQMEKKTTTNHFQTKN